MKSPGRSDRLVSFLTDPKSYPHRPRKVRLLQTHASFVAVAPPFVYKVKKPVNFGFLDFSTLERRRHYCGREVELNSRLSPEMYLGVVPISETGGQLSFGADGKVVEYAVKMRRLDERYFLGRLLARDAVGPKDLDRIAAPLKAFYEAQHPGAEIEEWGRIRRLKISTDENFGQTEEFVGRTISRPAFEAVRLYTRGFFACHAGRFDARIRQRWIRDCHGDLHIEHIHLAPRSLHIYDCIEFNDRFRYVDVASDIAFLAMDLDSVGRADLARHFVSRMSSALGDGGMLELMDFYKCYRAFVRGKVESLHSVAPHAPAAERETSADRARRYFRLALNYAVAGSRPLVLAVAGRIGSGKTTLANALAAELGWEVVSSDRVRKELAGLPLHERPGDAVRARLYSGAMTTKVYRRLLDTAEEAARTGRSIILDATFARRTLRARLRSRMKRVGIAFRFLEAEAGDREVRRRLALRGKAGLPEVSDARLEDFEKLARLYEPPDELPTDCRLAVRATGSIEGSVTRALQALARMAASQ